MTLSTEPSKGLPPNFDLIGVSKDSTGKTVSYIPPGLKLLQAHWFVRHGERSATGQRLTGPAGVPSVFPLCCATDALKLTPSDAQTTPTSVRPTYALTQEPNGRDSDSRCHCDWGQLTDTGRASAAAVGSALRHLYVDVLQFVPASYNPGSVALRSTDMPRTIETLFQLTSGLYPESTRSALHITVRDYLDESLYPNKLGCPRLKDLAKNTAAKVAAEYAPALAAFDSVAQRFWGSDQTLRVNGRPRASGILDTIKVCLAHGVPLPEELKDTPFLKTLEEAVVKEWFGGYQDEKVGNEVARLSMGRLLGDLRKELESAAAASDVSSDSQANSTSSSSESTPPPSLLLYACHDTSVGGITSALGVFDGHWPPFTSHVSVELFKNAAHAHYVRLRYNAEGVRIPACVPAGKHLEGSNGEVCTLDAFKEAVAAVEMGDDEWRTGCKTE